MKFIYKIIISISLLFVTLLIILPFFINHKSLQINLQNKLTSKFQREFNIDSGINISFFPRPKITINGASVNNLTTDDGYINIQFKTIEVKPSLFSLFGDLQIKEIELDEAKIHYIISYNPEEKIEEELNLIPEINNDFFVNKVFNFNPSNQDLFDWKNIPDIIINDSEILIADNNAQYLNYKNVNIELESSFANGRIYAEGSFISDKIPTIFDLNLSIDPDTISTISINSPILQGNITGKFFDSDNLSISQANFDGDIDIAISDLKLLLDKYFSSRNPIFKNINNTEDIKISSKLFIKDGSIDIENINIESNLISGSGEIIADNMEDIESLEVNLSIDYLDFDNLWIGKMQLIDDQYINDIITAISNNFNESVNIDHNKFPKLDMLIFGLSLKSKINIKELKYNDQLLTDINISATTENNNQIKIDNFEINFKDHSKFQINAILENIGSVIKLYGDLLIDSKNLKELLSLSDIKINGLKKENLKNFKARSKILILPNTKILKDIKLVLNDSSIISGTTSIVTGDDILNIDYDLNFNRLKIEDYFIENYFNQFITGKNFLKNFIGLNNIDINHNISLKFDQLSYNDFYLTDQVFDIKIGRGTIDIPSLLINHNSHNSSVKFYLDVYSPIPTLKLTFNSDHLAINDIDQNNLPNKFKSNSLNYFFNFPSLIEFDGDINIDIKNLDFNNINITDLKIVAPFKEGVINLEKLSASIFDGDVNILGDIVLGKEKRLNNSFQLIEISNKELFNNLFNINNLNSKSNFSGIITTTAYNRLKFYDNLDLEIKFISSGLTLERFGLQDLMIRINRSPQTIKNIEEITFSENAKTYFKEIVGDINIKANRGKKDLYITTKSPGLNSITSGILDLQNSKLNLTHNAVMIAIDTNNRPFPLRFALNAAGSIDNLTLSPNFSQIKQYLQIQ